MSEDSQAQAADSGSAWGRLAGALAGALESSGMPVALTDARRPGHPVVFVNAAFSALSGYRAEEAVGRNWDMLHGADTAPDEAGRIERALAAGEEARAEILHYRRDGSTFWNQLSVSPVPEPPARMPPAAFFLWTHSDVTPRRNAAASAAALADMRRELANAQESLGLVQANSAGFAWEWHVERNRLTGNARFASLCNVTALQAAEGIDPNAFFAVIDAQDRIRIRLAMGAMLRGAEVFAKEFRVVLADGSIRWVDGRGRCQYDSQDRPIRLSGTLQDITEQKRVEERLRIAQTAGGIGTFEYVQGFGTVSVSPQFCRLLGLHPGTDLPVRTINALVQAGGGPIIDTGRHAGMAAGAVNEVEFRIVRPDDGQVRWLKRRGEYLRDTETTGLRFSGVIYDITVAKRTEQRLRLLTESLESEVRARTRERDMVWRTSQDLFVVCGFDYVCHSANPAWLPCLGIAPEEVAGQRFDAFVHPDDVGLLGAHQASLSATADFDLRMRARDGSYRHVSWHVVPEGEQFTASGRDITDRKRLEDQLRQSQKMEAVGQLTGGLAHDFNNLLTGIAGSLELLQSRIAKGRLQDLERYVVAAQGASRRAAALTHRLLAFSRQQTLDARPTDVNRLVAGMEDLIRRTAGPAIELVVEAEADLWTVLIDQNQLENALLNLCINARDAMPDGGRLSICTACLTLDEVGARARDLAPGDYVTLSVADTGTGMTADVAARAFDPFFTTKPLGQGTGLGLSMIYGFARQSGGQARIERSAGRGAAEGPGTMICLYLPRHARMADEESLAEYRQPESGLVAKGETILVVDDEETIRSLVAEILQSQGYAAVEAADAASGLAHLRSGAAVDLLVTDVGLPGGMNGRQMAEMARVLRPGLKVLFITGYAEKAALAPGHLQDGMRVLTKPFSIDSLTTEVQRLFAE